MFSKYVKTVKFFLFTTYLTNQINIINLIGRISLSSSNLILGIYSDFCLWMTLNQNSIPIWSFLEKLGYDINYGLFKVHLLMTLSEHDMEKFNEEFFDNRMDGGFLFFVIMVLMLAIYYCIKSKNRISNEASQNLATQNEEMARQIINSSRISDHRPSLMTDDETSHEDLDPASVIAFTKFHPPKYENANKDSSIMNNSSKTQNNINIHPPPPYQETSLPIPPINEEDT
ncbi:hypothetical protein HZS_4357 [Henneguya salminicola]|nr:hypothetical protein HZS_4357 [Henneguya salminicola]